MGCCSSTKADKQMGKVATLLPKLVSAPRSLARFQEPIQSITLRAFRDASEHGVKAVVMAVVQQSSRQLKRGWQITIPRLHLRPHDANLVHNVREAIEGFIK